MPRSLSMPSKKTDHHSPEVQACTSDGAPVSARQKIGKLFSQKRLKSAFSRSASNQRENGCSASPAVPRLLRLPLLPRAHRPAQSKNISGSGVFRASVEGLQKHRLISDVCHPLFSQRSSTKRPAEPLVFR